ncbi:MAG: hypothetical protein J0M02_18680 [Planctomycetes bacterium]|nr:hypothetical protein [Planctomycetota bacterium]
MHRTIVLAVLATAAYAVDGWERIDPVQGSIGFSVASMTSSNVSLGPMSKSWSDATRGEIYFRSYYPMSQGVQPFFEATLFEDSQNYSENDGRIDCDTFGLGLSFGGTVVPFQDGPKQGLVGLGIMPYVRFAVGSSDVYIKDLVYDDQIIEGSGSVGRLDFGGGADIRLTVGRHLEAALGGGINFWRSADIDAVVTDQGTLVRVSESIDFSGRDVFLRASFGFSF